MAGVARSTAMAFKPLATFSASAASRQLGAQVQQRAFASVQRGNVLSAAREQRKSIAELCKRGYADQAPVVPAKELPKKKKRAGVLRWAWRLTYVSAIGMLGWSVYGIYQNRHPMDQQEPDPSKKTLVVLGKLIAMH
jgi:NADH:ubiquinone reductase (non-electrogenic)